MDTFEKKLRQLSQQGYLANHLSPSERLKKSLAQNDVLDMRDSASTQMGDKYQGKMDRLFSAYGLSNFANDIADQEIALRVAMSNSLTNLTGVDSLAMRASTSVNTLQQQIEDIISPLRNVQEVFAGARLQSDLLNSIKHLNVVGGLVGEFPYLDSSEIDSSESLSVEPGNEDREEVKSRIIQVEYLPQRLFDAIRNEPKLMRGLEPREFEEFTAELLVKLGFQGVRLTPQSHDGGRDIVATQVVNDIPVVMAFECKKYAEPNKIGPEFLRALLGTITQGETRASMGVLVTTSSFTTGARSFIAAEASIDGKDFYGLVRWLLKTTQGRNVD